MKLPEKVGQTGFSPILVVLLLLVGLGAGMTLVKNPQILKSRAQSPEEIQNFENQVSNLGNAATAEQQSELDAARPENKEQAAKILKDAKTAWSNAWNTAKQYACSITKCDSGSSPTVPGGLAGLIPSTVDTTDPQIKKATQLINDNCSGKDTACAINILSTQKANCTTQDCFDQFDILIASYKSNDSYNNLMGTCLAGGKSPEDCSKELAQTQTIIIDASSRFQSCPDNVCRQKEVNKLRQGCYASSCQQQADYLQGLISDTSARSPAVPGPSRPVVATSPIVTPPKEEEFTQEELDQLYFQTIDEQQAFLATPIGQYYQKTYEDLATAKSKLDQEDFSGKISPSTQRRYEEAKQRYNEAAEVGFKTDQGQKIAESIAKYNKALEANPQLTRRGNDNGI